jgi:hypothetical protein
LMFFDGLIDIDNNCIDLHLQIIWMTEHNQLNLVNGTEQFVIDNFLML